MILAGGRGERLGSLTSRLAKPLVHYGGNHRIIDFTLSNCCHSRINAIGVLTQHLSTGMHAYIKDGSVWNLADRVRILPAERKSARYRGTADAVYQNIDYVDALSPRHVLILSGDHIYKMDYNDMLAFHERNDADMTIASVEVPLAETSKYGILRTDGDGRVIEFKEKPECAKSRLASMGIYIFKWDVLRKRLIEDKNEKDSKNDFGHNIIPTLLATTQGVFAYRFCGYWRDVGTVESLWEAHMDLLRDPPRFSVRGDTWDIFTVFRARLPGKVSKNASVHNSLLSGACSVKGRVERSVLSDSVIVSDGAEVTDSVIMPNVYIGPNARISRAIVGPNANIMRGVEIGSENGADTYVSDLLCSSDVSLIGPGAGIFENVRLQKKSHVPNGLSVEDGKHAHARSDYSGKSKPVWEGLLL
ncbi:MAG: NTP transferase domain-containing protein [Clostridiales Family XIII bacterium]|jgi:glucose-1-phosphate adenylyltransferase|nr:NTP transferase domain-containing protein [Clostridiales Family XIII bacterium]